LEREVKDLSASITALTHSNDELKERLRVSETNSSKIVELKCEIDNFAERLLEKEIESTNLTTQL